MVGTGKLKITTSGERDLVIVRSFKAPRTMVWDAYTKPALLIRWLFGPDGWTLATCDIDLRVGGRYRYVWKHQKGHEMGMGGVYREIDAPERLVSTEKFDESWYPGDAVGTLVLTERDGVTTITQTMRYESHEALEAVLKSPMEEGLALGFDRLEKLLTSKA